MACPFDYEGEKVLQYWQQRNPYTGVLRRRDSATPWQSEHRCATQKESSRNSGKASPAYLLYSSATQKGSSRNNAKRIRSVNTTSEYLDLHHKTGSNRCINITI
jgi:hypothetical protein